MQNITKAELEILKILWDTPASIKEISDKLNKNLNTVKTLVYRLINKDIIFAQKKERGCVYVANINKDDFNREATKEFLCFFYGNDVEKLMRDLKRIKK